MGIRMKVSEKGAVAVNGMGRFPVTLYKEQWLRLLDTAAEICAFIAANEPQLKTKSNKMNSAAVTSYNGSGRKYFLRKAHPTSQLAV